jgi:hypothetical protein
MRADEFQDAVANLTAALKGYSVDPDGVDVNDLYDAATKAILDRDSSAIPDVARADAIAVVDVILAMLQIEDEESPP